MAFSPENDLERALVAAVTNRALWPNFYNLLLEAQIFVLGLVERGDDAIPGAMAKIRLTQLPFRNRIYHPIFTSLARLEPYTKEHPNYFSMIGRELFESTRGAYFLLNPGSEYAKELLPQEIAGALNPESLIDSQVGERILVTRPAVFPAPLAEALAKLFAERPQVEAAYIGQMTIEGRNDPPLPIVGVKMEGLWRPLAQEIQRVVAPMPQGIGVAAFQIGADPMRKALGDMLMRHEPFYTRKGSVH